MLILKLNSMMPFIVHSLLIALREHSVGLKMRVLTHFCDETLLNFSCLWRSISGLHMCEETRTPHLWRNISELHTSVKKHFWTSHLWRHTSELHICVDTFLNSTCLWSNTSEANICSDSSVVSDEVIAISRNFCCFTESILYVVISERL